jgi:hypothetical protein
VLVVLNHWERFQSAGASAHKRIAFLVTGEAIDIEAAIFVPGPATAGQFFPC